MSGWIDHHGRGAPVPTGTKVEAEQFNGEVITVVTGRVMFGDDGAAQEQSGPTMWSVWRYDDGGPMAPKFRRYRIVEPDGTRFRYAAMFNAWLNASELEVMV